MKKLSLLLALLLILGTGCSNKSVSDTPSPSPTPSETAKPASPGDNSSFVLPELKDKLSDNVYAGKVTKITDSEITIIMDEKVSETFTLNQRAKEDIRDFKIVENMRIIVKFVSRADRTITALEVIKVE